MFNNKFFEDITREEYALLFAILNADKSVLFDIENAKADALLKRLATASNLNQEGCLLRLSIFDKYRNATCIIDSEEVFIENEKPCPS